MAAREDVYISFEEACKILQDELKYPAEKAQQFVDRCDRNKDGKLSMCEFKTFCQQVEKTKSTLVPMFKEYDRDGNGYITLKEASHILQAPPFSFPATKVIMLLTRFDTDGNGKLDIEEFSDFYSEARALNEKVQSRFDELDRDKNGVLSADEVTIVLKDCMNLDDRMASHMVKMFDTNNDGNLDKTEFMNMWGSMWGGCSQQTYSH